jgi:aspartate/methionine/tyrosine aminotransferase
MTGWRMGWLVLPASLADAMGKLIEFNTSCASVFTQRAALAALAHRKEITPRIVAHFKQCRDTLVPLLAQVPGVQVASARGGMYAFFRIEGFDDSMAVAKRLVAEAGVGLAPGDAFGPEGRGWLRWCFASKDVNRLAEGVRRLQQWLESNRAA